ncbi:MAG: bile acid:sodium symporter [Proteobacteria bacterium]|nr:bile acid:sodium symporter [Pseudomonadota bacterium]MBU1232473.1 bile acid:sodium symporter [Pseudomonadota bacterium]MBU1417293.1 bile acid:sodium symporter [Pseudomonadota bacterium]MBU1453964.1 bile acid:sodium symporter [Pseudomonadota bacterium]
MRQLFLPLGLILAVLCGLLMPSAGTFLAENSGLKILVFIIFVVSGFQTGSKGFSLDRRLLALFLTAAIISLIIAPVLGLLFAKLLHFPPALAIGLIIISAVPPTLSSGIVIAEVSGGNAVLALFLTVSLNLLGIFTMPFMLDLCLKAAGPIDIDQTALLLKMLFFVLLPFVIGKLIRTLSGKSKVSPNWSYVNSSCIILVVYASLASSRNAFSGLGVAEFALIGAGVSLVHILLLVINHQAGKLLRLPAPDRKALLFVASQKTLPISVAVLANIQLPTGSAIIVCLMFHFFQLVLDSFLASYLHKKTA